MISLFRVQSELSKARGPGEKRKWRREVKALRKELRQRREVSGRERGGVGGRVGEREGGREG